MKWSKSGLRFIGNQIDVIIFKKVAIMLNLDTYITKEARQIVGEKNRQRLLGSKLPESTKENMRKAAAKGSSSRLSKLTDSEVLEIAALIRAGKSDYAIAPIFNVTRENIAHIRKGHTWSHLTGFARS